MEDELLRFLGRAFLLLRARSEVARPNDSSERAGNALNKKQRKPRLASEKKPKRA